MTAFFDFDFAASQAHTLAIGAVKAFGRSAESEDTDTRLVHLAQAQDHARNLVAFLDKISPEVAAIVDGPKEKPAEGGEKPAQRGRRSQEPAGHA